MVGDAHPTTGFQAIAGRVGIATISQALSGSIVLL